MQLFQSFGTKRGTRPIRCALLVTTPRWVVGFSNPDARQWLKQFFDPPDKAGLLPRDICLWLAAKGGRSALEVKKPGKRLVVRRYWPHPEDSIALHLELIKDDSPIPSRTLTRLTWRENEVLGWIAAGKSNRDAAEILGLSPKTVGKHIERIFAKLGVENRTSAANFYYEATDLSSQGAAA